MFENVKKGIVKLWAQYDIIKKHCVYGKVFLRYSFVDCKCSSFEQYEASITRLYHTIEKGLSYANYRAGFGKGNIEALIVSLEQYVKKGYDTSAFAYESALSCLYAYMKKNNEYGYEDKLLEERVRKMPGHENGYGGTIQVSCPESPENLNYEQLVKMRHSIRHFSDTPLDMETIKDAISLAQYTPSACNRQGWRTRIVADREKVKEILLNQNGNRGFENEIDKLLVVTADLRAQQKNRELYQAFIDGGMYAENILNALYYKGIGSVPLSASLTTNQEKAIRKLLDIEPSEVFILFIGVGNYPKSPFLTTRSERRKADIEIY